MRKEFAMLKKTKDAITAAVFNVFTDPRFKRLKSRVYGYVGVIDGKRIGVVAATKSQRFANSADHVLNKSDFDHLIAALDASRRDEAYVVSAETDQSGNMTVIDAIEARELAAILANVKPRIGGLLGDFYLVNPHFTTEEEDF
jgi:hypothetical protein